MTAMDPSPASDPDAAWDGDRARGVAARIAESGDERPNDPAALPDVDVPSATSLAGDLPGARRRLPVRVVRYWRWRAFLGMLPVAVVLISVAIARPAQPSWAGWGVVVAVLVLVAGAVTALTQMRYRVFWYAISSTEIDIQHGIVFTVRSVVPMQRVQSLRIERGPVADHYRVANVKIRTAGGSVGLSGLDRDEAITLCDRISRLAQLVDDV